MRERIRRLIINRAVAASPGPHYVRCIRMKIEEFIEKLAGWSASQASIKGVLLVGSHARGTARADSDIDIVIVCAAPDELISSNDWLSFCGRVKCAERENWGPVKTWRVFYEDRTEVEFGITTEQWCTADEIDPGTRRVISEGARAIYDPHFLVRDLIAAVKPEPGAMR